MCRFRKTLREAEIEITICELDKTECNNCIEKEPIKIGSITIDYADNDPIIVGKEKYKYIKENPFCLGKSQRVYIHFANKYK
jgi:hypothetical protein